MCTLCLHTRKTDSLTDEWLRIYTSKRRAMHAVRVVNGLIYARMREPILSFVEELLLQTTTRALRVNIVYHLPSDILQFILRRLRAIAPRLFGTGWEEAGKRLTLSVNFQDVYAGEPYVQDVIKEYVQNVYEWYDPAAQTLAREVFSSMLRDYLSAGRELKEKELKRALERKWNQFRLSSQERMNRGLLTSGFERGQLEAIRYAGARKRWLSQRDDRVRPSHWEADGQEREAGEPFLVGGYPLMHPGDPRAPLEEVVNCRCSMLPVID